MMIIQDRSTLERLYNDCIADNLDIPFGVFYRNPDDPLVWRHSPPGYALSTVPVYKAVFKLTNIGREIDFLNIRLRVGKTMDPPIKLYREPGGEDVEWVDCPAVPAIKSVDSPRDAPSEVYQTVYFHPLRDIQPGEREKLFKTVIAATVVVLGSRCCGSPTEAEFSAPAIQLPERLDFGLVQVGSVYVEKLELVNTGQGLLDVTQIVVAPMPEFSASGGPALPLTLSPGQVTSISVSFCPPEFGDRQGGLTIYSTDPLKTEAFVRLIGRGMPRVLP